jgi:hypothetical protein
MFRFTIRELVMLTMIVALLLGLWIAQPQFTTLRNEIDRLREECSGSPNQP